MTPQTAVVAVAPEVLPVTTEAQTSIPASTQTSTPTEHAVVAVVGLGYVGLPTAIAMGNAGAEIVGIDVSAPRLDTIRAETEVKALRPSSSRPGQGIVTFEHLGLNQRDEVVCRTTRAALMMAKPT